MYSYRQKLLIAITHPGFRQSFARLYPEPQNFRARGPAADCSSLAGASVWARAHHSLLSLTPMRYALEARYITVITMLVVTVGANGILNGAEGSPATFEAVRLSMAKGDTEGALRLASQIVEAQPKASEPYVVRAAIYSSLGKHELAVADYNRAVALQLDTPELYNLRGDSQFKLGKFEASIRDYDRFIELVPGAERSHWKRGISYYYAGQYEKGRRQFEGYQTFDDNDVENAVWRFLCMARKDGVQAARDSMLKIRRDTRVPMMKIYDLYTGKAGPDDVLAEARRDKPTPGELNTRLFYAHLYLGLYHEVSGNVDRARTHLTTAADEHRISHYMWDVARVHAGMLNKNDQ